jgi:hypothetical protein
MPNGWYNIYVIELTADAPLPARQDLSMPYLYVGITNNTPERRFEIHKQGGRTSSDIVRKYGIRLLPQLYQHLKRVTRADAGKYEQEYAEKLRKAGYVVYSGRPGLFGDQFTKRP